MNMVDWNSAQLSWPRKFHFRLAFCKQTASKQSYYDRLKNQINIFPIYLTILCFVSINWKKGILFNKRYQHDDIKFSKRSKRIQFAYTKLIDYKSV